VKRFRGGLVFKAHRLVYHSTLGLRVIKKQRRRESGEDLAFDGGAKAREDVQIVVDLAVPQHDIPATPENF